MTELADVLSTIVARIRGDRLDVPLMVSYDKNERVYNPAHAAAVQWRRRLDHRAVSETALRTYLDHALTEIGVKDGAGQPMRYTFHDFRRLFTPTPSPTACHRTSPNSSPDTATSTPPWDTRPSTPRK